MAWFLAVVFAVWIAAAFYLLLNGRPRPGVILLIALVVVAGVLLIVALIVGILDSLTHFST